MKIYRSIFVPILTSGHELCLAALFSSQRCGKAKEIRPQILRPISLSIVPLLANKTPRYSSTWAKDSFPTRSRQSTDFLQRVMASDLEVLILIQATSLQPFQCVLKVTGQ